MPDYNFQTLNDREFEKLTRDLLQEELELTFESFKPGRDGGIDLRHVSPKEDATIVVQAKHWPRSDFKRLFNHLKKDELKKIKKLNPSRYILVTSVEFNPDDKDKIKELLSPYVLSTADIYGRDDVNGLLGKFSDIETGHSKLWLSSVPVLRRIIDNGIRGRSEFEASKIEKNLSLYVPNQKYSDSLKILNDERFLVIIGEPGIGKTVLARMLVYQLLGDGYKLITVNERVSEAEDLWDPGVKQVFYFDDFLGANYLELAQKQNSDSALVDFITRVKNDPLKRLILTSRTTVLNHAAQVYPRLESPIINLAKHEVKIENYSKLDRAHILYNHLYFLGLPNEYLEKVKEDKNYWKIINHDNYNPRLIEFISDPMRLEGIDPEYYVQFIQDKLDNPIDIWQHPYQHQTDDYCKFLLQTLFSLGEDVDEQDLKKAFNARLDYEIENNGFKRESDVFALRVKDLLGGFIIANRHGSELIFNFFNPSIVDFLVNMLNKNTEEKWRVLESIVFTDQLNAQFSYNDPEYLAFSKSEILRLKKILSNKEGGLVNTNGGSPQIELLVFYGLAFPSGEFDIDCARLVGDIEFDAANISQAQSLILALKTLHKSTKTKKVSKKRWREAIDFLFTACWRKSDLDAILEIFELYEEKYDVYISNENSKTLVERSLNKHWNDQIDDIESGEDVSMFSEVWEVESYLEDTYTDGVKYNKKFGFSQMNVMNLFDHVDPDAVAETARERFQAEDFMDDYQKEEYKIQHHEERSVEDEINELFQ